MSVAAAGADSDAQAAAIRPASGIGRNGRIGIDSSVARPVGLYAPPGGPQAAVAHTADESA